MRFKKAIWIPVYEYTEDELALKDLIDLPESEGVVTKRPFWSIDSAYKGADREGTTVFYSGGEVFISSLPLKSFVELVDNH